MGNASELNAVANGTGEVGTNITEVKETAGETGRSTNSVLSSANELYSLSEGLKVFVNEFLLRIRKDAQRVEDET